MIHRLQNPNGRLPKDFDAAARGVFFGIVFLLTAGGTCAQAPAVQELKELEQKVQKLAETLDKVTVSVSGGSGVLVGEDGYILSAAHVTRKPGRELVVTLSSGKTFRARTLGANHETDVGLLKIVPESNEPHERDSVQRHFVSLSKKSPAKNGQFCVAGGYPIAYAPGKAPAIRLGRTIHLEADKLTTNCRIMGGDSGGPLLNLNGDLIGITSRVLGTGKVAIHVPVASIVRDWDRLANGEVWNEQARQPINTRKFDMAAVAEADEHLGQMFVRQTNLSDHKRAIVRMLNNDQQLGLGTAVAENLFVAKASLLQKGFRCQLSTGEMFDCEIVAIDELYDVALIQTEKALLKPVRFPEEAADKMPGCLLASVAPDGRSYIGAGIATCSKRMFSIAKSDYASNDQRGFLGVMTDNAVENDGLEVRRVLKESAAEIAGIQTGDRIIKCDEVVLESPRQFALLLDKKSSGDTISLSMIRSGESEPLKTEVELKSLPREFAGSQMDRWGGGPFSQRRFGFTKVVAHDTVIAPADCGGPIVDQEGRFVGINIARALTAHTVAISAEDLQDVVEKLKASQPDSFPKRFDEIDTSGITGALILNGSGRISDGAIKSFVSLRRKSAKEVDDEDDEQEQHGLIISFDRSVEDSGEQPAVEAETTAERLAKAVEEFELEFSFSRESIDLERLERDDNLIKQITKLISNSSHIWIEGEDRRLMQSVLSDVAIRKALTNKTTMDRVLSGNSVFSSLVGSFMPATDSKTVVPSLNLLSQAIVVDDDAKPFDPASLPVNKPLFVMEFGGSSTLLIAGRSIIRIAGLCELHFPRSEAWAADTIQLDRNRNREDLISMKRYALRRLGPPAPSPRPLESNVAHGSLIIIGGGGTPDGLLEKFVELAGGPEAKIVVIPISTAPPLPRRERIVAELHNLGAAKVTVLRGRTSETVTDTDTLAALREATGIWFGGGRQWRFVDAYEDTEGVELMHAVLNRGGVIAGSSAGATIQGEFLARGNPLGSPFPSCVGYEKGFSFLPGTAIDQHFAQRNRFADLGGLIERYPQLLGIGVDESTGLIVNRNIASVVGANQVWFYDRRKSIQSNSETPTRYDRELFQPVGEGGSFDLTAGEVLERGRVQSKTKPGVDDKEAAGENGKEAAAK